MGYPMTYKRVINRNHLQGDYGQPGGLIPGDLRRLEKDAVDGGYICQRIAEATGAKTETVQAVLTAFFEMP